MNIYQKLSTEWTSLKEKLDKAKVEWKKIAKANTNLSKVKEWMLTLREYLEEQISLIKSVPKSTDNSATRPITTEDKEKGKMISCEVNGDIEFFVVEKTLKDMLFSLKSQMKCLATAQEYLEH